VVVKSTRNPVKYKLLALAAVIVSVVLYCLLGYAVPRSDFEVFFGAYLLLFGLFYWLWLNRQQFSFYQFLVLAVLFRLILLFAGPGLSNDFYRFLWDGELTAYGINPYAYTPASLRGIEPFANSEYMISLYHGMGGLSQSHYSCYPPLNQVFFLVPALASGSITTSLVVLKIMMILADLGTIFVARKIFTHLGMDDHRTWLYALNPFVILEFTGNLHFEGVMIFFLLLSIYCWMKNQWLMSAVLVGLAVHVKLVPLILIPFFLKKLHWRKSAGFVAVISLTIVLTGFLFLNRLFLAHMLNSISSYFVHFEFNASVFYIIREIGFAAKGYDTIAFWGPVLAVIAAVSILALAILRRYRDEPDIFKGILFALLIYYAFATTVHPWYIGMILIASIFTPYRFGLVWSFLVMLSYSAYDGGVFKENGVLIFTEYIVLGLVILAEIRSNWGKGLINGDYRGFFKLKNEQN
jgi:alpha-1,6-mannosyltransferase